MAASRRRRRIAPCDTDAMDTAPPNEHPPRLTISLKTLSELLDANRVSVRRWLSDAGIKPVVMGRGRNGAIRYRWRDIEGWLESLDTVE